MLLKLSLFLALSLSVFGQTTIKTTGATTVKATGATTVKAAVSSYSTDPPGYAGANATGIRSASGGTVVSSSLTVAGNNTMLVAMVGEYGSTISGVATSGGQNLTKLSGLDSYDASGKAELWYLIAPTAGAQTVTATMAANVNEASISVMLITNVASITVGGTHYSAAVAESTFTASVTSGANDLAGSGVVYYSGVAMTATGTGHTKRADATNPPVYDSSLVSTMTSANGSTALGWSAGVATQNSEITFNLAHP